MKKLIQSLFLLVFITQSQTSFCLNLSPPKKKIESSKVPTAPDVKKAIPGTPFFRTVGTKGVAVQCLYPFNRHCLLFAISMDVSDEGQCFNQFTIDVPLSGELIEPNTFHLGLYDESGALVYRDITNSIRQYSCDQGFFEIIFPEGY